MNKINCFIPYDTPGIWEKVLAEFERFRHHARTPPGASIRCRRISIPEVPGALGGIGRIERLALHDCSHALEALTDIEIEGLASI